MVDTNQYKDQQDKSRLQTTIKEVKKQLVTLKQ